MDDQLVERGIPFQVAICGSAGGSFDDSKLEDIRSIGRQLAKAEVTVISGATVGYSYEAVKAAYEAGGLTVGISPAISEYDHMHRYKKPSDVWRVMIFTGMGFKSRNAQMVHSSDGAFFFGGGTGTLNEFTIAHDENKPIAILKGIPGTMEVVEQIVEKNYREAPPMLIDDDPEALVAWMLEQLQDRNEERIASIGESQTVG